MESNNRKIKNYPPSHDYLAIFTLSAHVLSLFLCLISFLLFPGGCVVVNTMHGFSLFCSLAEWKWFYCSLVTEFILVVEFYLSYYKNTNLHFCIYVDRLSKILAVVGSIGFTFQSQFLCFICVCGLQVLMVPKLWSGQLYYRQDYCTMVRIVVLWSGQLDYGQDSCTMVRIVVLWSG